MVDPTEPIVAAEASVITGLDHWRTLPIKQQPTWPDAAKVAAASAELATQPPLVFAGEVDILRDRLAQAAGGQGFLLQMRSRLTGVDLVAVGENFMVLSSQSSHRMK